MKTAGGWRDDRDDLPKFGRKARAWFARQLAVALLMPPKGWECYRLTPHEEIFRDRLVESLANESASLVIWVDDDEYRGRGFSNGSWVFDWDAIFARVRQLLKELKVEAEASKYATLDDWLRAEIAGALTTKGAEGGADRLPKAMRRSLVTAARARRKNLPKICKACGELFHPTCNRAQRCSDCI